MASAVADDLRTLLRLALPVIVAEVGWMFMGVVDTLMVGPLGPQAIAAVSIGNAAYDPLAVAAMGLLLGLGLGAPGLWAGLSLGLTGVGVLLVVAWWRGARALSEAVPAATRGVARAG